MTHASRATAAAMLATARPEPAEVSDLRAEQWRRARDMYGEESKHGQDCIAGGCNACILDDVHRIIFGVPRQSEG